MKNVGMYVVKMIDFFRLLGVCPCVATGKTIFLHKHQSDEGIYLAFLQDWNNKVYYTTYKNNP